jgi:MFS family permease
MWYTRREQPLRIGLWYTANGLGIAGGGLLGYGIGHIRGALASWRYEFLIVGALCSVWGIVMFIFLPDSPVTAPGLSLASRRLAVERLRGNQTGVENKHFKFYQLKEACLDYKTYLLFLLGIVGNVPNGGISNFGTLIIKSFGFSTLVTTLMQIPYGAIICVSILCYVFLNDRLGSNLRSIMIICSLIPNLAGAFGLRFIPSDKSVARLICYYLTGPYNAGFVLILSLSIANVSGHTKKVITNAATFLGYCTGNIIGPFFYTTDQAPEYPLGIWSMIVSHLLEICVVLVLRFLLKRENERRDRLQKVGKWVEVSADGDGVVHPDNEEATSEQVERNRKLNLTAFGDLTDRENLNFRYIY